MTPNAVMPASTRTAAPTSSARERRRGRGRAAGGRLAFGLGGRGRVERGVVREDLIVEALQLGARLDPDLVHEPGARRPVGGERIGLPAGAVEREHVLRVQVLAERLRRHEPLELADHLGMPPRLHVGVDRHLGSPLAQRVEAPDLRGRERLVRHVGERVTAPQGERLAGARLLEQPLEAHRVDILARHLQLIAAATRDDAAVAVEHPPQVRHVELHHLRRARRRLLAPQPLRQAVRRHRPPHLEREHRENRPLLAGAQLDGPIPEANLERP